MSLTTARSWKCHNNLCFHVPAQKWLFVILCQFLIVGTCWTTFVFICRLKSDCLSCCDMSNGLCWSFGHATFVFMCKLESNCQMQIPPLSCQCTNHRAGSQLKFQKLHTWQVSKFAYFIYLFKTLTGCNLNSHPGHILCLQKVLMRPLCCHLYINCRRCVCLWHLLTLFDLAILVVLM